MPVTAEDVRWTWQAQIHPDVAWEERLHRSSTSRDVEVVDPQTVRFHFDSRLRHAAPRRQRGLHPAQARLGASSPSRSGARTPTCSAAPGGRAARSPSRPGGPSRRSCCGRNPRYYRAGPAAPRPAWSSAIIPDAASQADPAPLRRARLPPPGARRRRRAHRRSDRARLIAYWGRRYVFVCWNNAGPLFADPEVRRALTLAIDRQTIVDTLWGEHGQVADLADRLDRLGARPLARALALRPGGGAPHPRRQGLARQRRRRRPRPRRQALRLRAAEQRRATQSARPRR